MTNPPPSFQVPDNNEPDDGRQPYVPPQGGQAWQPPPSGPGTPGAPGQAGAPPPAYAPQGPPPGQQAPWAPPQAADQWAPPQAAPWAPPPTGQPSYGPPPGSAPSGAQQPPQQYMPPQQPQWSGGGGYVEPQPPGPPPGSSGPGNYPPGNYAPGNFQPGSMPPPAGPPTGHGSGPGTSGFRPAAGPVPPAAYGPPARPQDIQLGPPLMRPRKHKRSWLLPLGVAAALVAAAALPGAVGEAKSDAGESKAGTPLAKAEVLWSIREGRDVPESVPVTKFGEGRLARTGVWYTAANIVVAEEKRVAAYDKNTGRLAWEYSSSAGEFVCDVDLQSGDKQAYVAFGGKQDCTTLEAIELDQGKKVWSADVADSGDTDTPGLEDYVLPTEGISVSDGTVVFDGKGYRATDGRNLWSLESSLGEGCTSDAVTGGTKLIAKVSCGYDSGTILAELNVATGKPKWQFEVPGGAGFSLGGIDVVSTDPVVVVRSHGALSTQPPEVTVLDDQGKEAFKITDGFTVAGPRGSSTSLVGNVPVLASDKVIYVPGSDMSASLNQGSGSANLVTAVDRKTGQKLWTTSVAEGKSTLGLKQQGKLYPVRVEESGDLLVMVQDGGMITGRPMSLVRLSAADGTLTNLKEFPGRATLAVLALMRDVLFHEENGRVYVAGHAYPVDKELMENVPNAFNQSVTYNLRPYHVIAME
ncbi:outer membrane protein assembly factor BamB family protein [Streptodolium elevatio]